MSLPIVASLWIGGSLSYIEQVCLKSFVDHGHRTILYTYGETSGVPEGVEVIDANLIFPNDNFIRHAKSGSPAVHADAFRYRMIELQNVIWVDADMLCMRPWDFKDQWVFGWEKESRLVCNAVLGLPRFSKTLARLNDLCKTEFPIPPWAKPEEKARLEAARDAGNPVHVSELEWGVWGPAALTHFLFETGEMEHVLPQMAFFPISFKYRRDLLDPGFKIDEQLDDGCYGVHLWNRRLRRRIVTNEGGLAHPDSFLGRALARHNIDMALAPIPDEPPASILAERAEQEAQEAAKDAESGSPLKKGSVKAYRNDADDDDDDTPGSIRSTNFNVTLTRPAALDEMPVMPSVQSPEYQQMIDGLEGRTGNIMGYLADPVTPIRNDKILVVTSMKNEAPFILEWIAYHRSIGVDHFLVYTNNCTDNTNAMLDRLSALDYVTRLDNPWDPASGKKPQQVALKDATKQACYAAADWILTIDCDEFVNIHVGDGKFADLFRASNYPNVISFTWKFFGNKDIHAYEDRPIVEQFTQCAPEFIPKPRLGWGFKSMFNKASAPYTRIGVHRPLGIDEGEENDVRWVNGSGRAMPDMLLTNNGWRSTKRSLGYRLATLNHYILRSAESLLVKRDRGRINHTEHDQGIDYWMRRNYATETDDRILARLPDMYKELDKLRADPQLAAMHEEAVVLHKDKIKSLQEKPDYKQLFDDLTLVKRPDALEISLAAEAEQNSEKARQQTALETANAMATAQTTQREPKKQDPASLSTAKPAPAAAPAGKINLTFKRPEPLTSLRLIKAPASVSDTLVHDRFDEARAFAAKTHGFLWEGPENAVLFAPRSKRLVVVFDNISNVREEGPRWPWGFKVVWKDMGCSVLGVMGTQRNWFRHDFVHDAFESLRDQGFFEQFDEVLFYGASMGGYGALVYSQCAPGANVLAIAPQSTLNRDILPRDNRWGWTAKLDWKGRFNDAANVLQKAGTTTIISDPYFEPDREQVSRIKGDRITHLKTPFMGHQLPNAFVLMGMLKPLLFAAADNSLTPALFYKLFRNRRDLPRFQHDILMEAEKRGKLRSAIRVCEYTLKRRDAKNIARSLDRLKGELAKTQKQAAE